MPRAFLTTYRPLCATAAGQRAIERYGLRPFIDGSCRREPDFESVFPTITALCRGRMFAPRLAVGDRVAFMTKKGRYGPGQAHWRLVALLRVVETFNSHQDAAEWFVHRRLPIPRNCMVEGNPPAPLDQTDEFFSSKGCSAEQTLKDWDHVYRKRANDHPQVRVCERIFLDLLDPPAIYAKDWKTWVGRIPGTQTPPSIDEELWTSLAQLAAS